MVYSKLIDYDYIEDAFREVVRKLKRTTDCQRFYNELIKLKKSIRGFKAFIVLGGSYQERMMTAKSDLDFWVMLYGEGEFKIPKRLLNRLFRNEVVNPVFKKIQKRYPNVRPCGASVRVFREFTEDIYNKLSVKNSKGSKKKLMKRISSGLKIISFGKVVNVDIEPFAGKFEYVELRRKFKEFWKNRNIDVWNVWGDLTEKLDKVLRNLKRYKGKSLYRVLQLSIQQMSSAYGYPEKRPHTLSLYQKLINWTGRPRFTRKKLKELIPLIEKMRISNLRANQLRKGEYERLKTQLTFFTQNLYKPFRKWIPIIACILNIFERMNINIKYFGASKTHAYIIFSSKKEFPHIKGIDLEEFSSTKVSFLANLGRIDKTTKDLLEKRGYQIFYEERDAEGEVTHKSGFKGRSRIHVLLETYEINDIMKESERKGQDLLKKLMELEELLAKHSFEKQNDKKIQ